MAGVKGRSGTNKGKDKPFAEALRMEIADAGDDHKALRRIARNLIELASSPVYEAMPAIKEVADRLDGKPAQESTVNINDEREQSDWTRDKLVAFLDECRASGNPAPKANGRGGEPDSVH